MTRAIYEAVLAERVCCARFCYVITFVPGETIMSLTVDATHPYVASLKAIYATLLLPGGEHD